MKPLSRLTFNQIGDPPSGPKSRTIAQNLRTLLQALPQERKLSRLQSWFAARTSGLPEGFSALSFPSLMPAADRLTVDAELSGDFALTAPSVKKSGSFQPPAFELLKIACDTFRVAHARNLPQEAMPVTILCERQ